jgi:hypothetical protein
MWACGRDWNWSIREYIIQSVKETWSTHSIMTWKHVA